MNKKITFLLSLLAFACLSRAEQVLEVVKLSSAQQIECLSSFAKITFRNDSIFIYDDSKALVSQNAFADVRVLVFEDIPVETAIEDVVSNQPFVCIYPNPATYTLRVKNYEPVTHLAVYSLTGEQLAVDYAIDDAKAEVNVATLPTGSYILFINQSAVKFIKQ